MCCSAKIEPLWLCSAASWSSVFFKRELVNGTMQNRTDVLGEREGRMGEREEREEREEVDDRVR